LKEAGGDRREQTAVRRGEIGTRPEWDKMVKAAEGILSRQWGGHDPATWGLGPRRVACGGDVTPWMAAVQGGREGAWCQLRGGGARHPEVLEAGLGPPRDGWLRESAPGSNVKRIDLTPLPLTTAKFFAVREVMARHLPQGQILPPIPPSPRMMTLPPIRFTESASMGKNLPPSRRSLRPKTLEALGQGQGCVLYRTVLPPGRAARLMVTESHDFVVVMLDGKPVGTLDRMGSGNLLTQPLGWNEGSLAAPDRDRPGTGGCGGGGAVSDAARHAPRPDRRVPQLRRVPFGGL